MPQSVEQFIRNLPSPDVILHKLDENAAERELLREMLKLAMKNVTPVSDKLQEVAACQQ